MKESLLFVIRKHKTWWSLLNGQPLLLQPMNSSWAAAVRQGGPGFGVRAEIN